MNNFAVQILLDQLFQAHRVLDQTMEGVTDEVAHFMPPGTANPIAGTYAHLVFSEDLFVQGFLKKEPPLFESKFKDMTGASSLQPTEWEKEYPKWLKEVKLDMKKFQEYAKVVFAESERYIGTLTDQDLEKDIDLSAMGMGTRNTSDFIASIINGHITSITGEISVLKGIQGLKGYPF